VAKKIGRNDPCPCGSGKKRKKCHPNLKSRRPPLHDPAFVARAWAVIDEKLADERKRKAKFGDVLPVVHADAWGKRLVGVGNQIYSTNPEASFADFLLQYLREALGLEWWRQEQAKPYIARHPVAQWETHAEELMRAGTPDERGRVSIPRDGRVAAYMVLAYDLYVVRQNTRFQEELIEQLRRREHFSGKRYELLVAAVFARAGFQIDPEDESKTARHPEFVATHRTSQFVMAVEAKARNRRQNDTNPEKAGVDDLIRKAATQTVAGKPFALFVDVAMPPVEPGKEPSWTEEVDRSVNAVVESVGKPGPFDLVMFTNIPHRYGLSGQPDPPKEWVIWLPTLSRIPPAIVDALIKSLKQYGNIPDYESGS
jgi:hypothetical protein